MSDEFDDVERDGSYVSSKKARAEMRRLAGVHGLSFENNAGGGEFNGAIHCQISTYDDIADLAELRAAIATRSRHV